MLTLLCATLKVEHKVHDETDDQQQEQGSTDNHAYAPSAAFTAATSSEKFQGWNAELVSS